MAIATRSGAYIGGHWIDGDGERIEVTSPGTGETVGSVTASSGAQVNAAVRAAAEPFRPGGPLRSWSGSTSAAAPTRYAWSAMRRSPG